MHFRSAIYCLLAVSQLATCQHQAMNDEKPLVQDTASSSISAHDNMSSNSNDTASTPVSAPPEVKPGLYTFWTLMVPPADHLQIAVEQTSDSDKQTLWGRFNYDGKDIVFTVDDVASGTISPISDYLNLQFTWRARSVQYGLVMFEDDQLRGQLAFITDAQAREKQLRPMRHVQMSLHGAGMWRESYVEAIKVEDFVGRQQDDLVVEIKRLWEGMATDTNRADMDSVRANYGSVFPPRHGSEL